MTEQLTAFSISAEILERGNHAALDPLPPEQRDLALEILKRFDEESETKGPVG